MSEERKSRYELFLEEEAHAAQPTKRCPKCDEVKTLVEYSKRMASKDGLNIYCKGCQKKYKSKKYPRIYKSHEDRFWKYYWSHVERVKDCLEWKGMYHQNKLPRCKYEGKSQPLRRVVYRLALGEIPENMFVLVVCRNHKCVRQSHIRLGTKEDLDLERLNKLPSGDAHYARTHPERVKRGEDVPGAKVTEDVVRAIRAEYVPRKVPYCVLAERYGVALSTVNHIVRRITWAHVE